MYSWLPYHMHPVIPANELNGRTSRRIRTFSKATLLSTNAFVGSIVTLACEPSFSTLATRRPYRKHFAVHSCHSQEPPPRSLPLVSSPTSNSPIEQTVEQKAVPSLKRHQRPSIESFLKSRVLAGFDPTPELGAILTVYFVQGALGISRLALTFFQKDTLHLSPAEVSSLAAISILPWLIKPVYGFLSDSLPLFGYRRRSYLIAAGLLGAFAWISLATIADTYLTVSFFSVLSSASVAVSDVVADSLVVERVRDAPPSRSGALQSLCWGTSAVGGLLSAYFGGSLLDTLTPRQIFALTATLPLLCAGLAGLVREERVPGLTGLNEARAAAQDRARALWRALGSRSVFLPVLFVFLWQASPNPDAALFFFNTNVLGFGPEFLGRARLAASVSSLVGLVVYNRWLKNLDVKTVMLWATLASLPVGLAQLLLVLRLNVTLGVSDQLFALADTAVLAAIGQIAFLPTLVLAARLCPSGVEGTLFAALMSIYNASGVASSQLGAMLTSSFGITSGNFDHLWQLVAVCNVSSLFALPLLSLVDEAPPATAEESLEAECSTKDI